MVKEGLSWYSIDKWESLQQGKVYPCKKYCIVSWKYFWNVVWTREIASYENTFCMYYVMNERSLLVQTEVFSSRYTSISLWNPFSFIHYKGFERTSNSWCTLVPSIRIFIYSYKILYMKQCWNIYTIGRVRNRIGWLFKKNVATEQVLSTLGCCSCFCLGRKFSECMYPTFAYRVTLLPVQSDRQSIPWVL